MKKCALAVLLLLGLLSGCSDGLVGDMGQDGREKIRLAGEISQLAVTRVNDDGFCDLDAIGVYVVDYDGNTPGTLKTNGNHGDNVKFTFDEGNGSWNSSHDLYWSDKHTHVDIYGYYPYAQPTDVGDYRFEVRRDQGEASENGQMGGYEASDFLWGKVPDVAPTASVIRVPMHHRMACARVKLEQGNGFGEGEWASLDKTVLATNLIRKASINIADGSVRAVGMVEPTATMPARVGDEWRAIVVPQTVGGGTTLFSITVGGQPFRFSRSDEFTYVQGNMSNFTIRVDKKLPEGTYKLTLVAEGITPWESDLVSHDADGKAYVVVNSTEGNLKDSIVAAKKDYTKLKNLKVTGCINVRDFDFMRDEMTVLQSINLKEVKVKPIGQTEGLISRTKDAIPDDAFFGKTTLLRVILPDELKFIGLRAFEGSSITGSLIIPEGVTTIDNDAFSGCRNLTGTLSLPTTLKTIGGNTFSGCSNLTGNLILPDKLEEIGWGAFLGCRGLFGNVKLPEALKKIGNDAFYGCYGFRGDIVIPKGVTELPDNVFNHTGFDGMLTLHDGITHIGIMAFANSHFKGELRFPKSLPVIPEQCCVNNDGFTSVVFPTDVVHIDHEAFARCSRLSGVLEFPKSLHSVGESAFAYCGNLGGVVFPKELETLHDYAFKDCFGLSSIVCKGGEPAKLYTDVFSGVSKDNFAVEVPEASLGQYKSFEGWKEFKRITAHHELVCNPQALMSLNASRKHELTLYAEGDWEVAGKPSWCEVSPSRGSGKTHVTITVNQLVKGAADRSGKVVFGLVDNDYTSECEICQYDYVHAEDEWLTLQKATKGNNGGINIVVLGDGFDAKGIADGTCLRDVRQQVENFFAIEPYKSYRDYFNVYTAMALSAESGVGTESSGVQNRFGTEFANGEGVRANYEEIFSYVLGAPTVTTDNLKETLVMIVPNTTQYDGITQMWSDGSAIAFCPFSTDNYPYDSRGFVQHEAGGHAFGKLADEDVTVNTFVDDGTASWISYCQSLGWYDNISLSAKASVVPWGHLVFDSRYSAFVDVYEGGYGFARGVFRSEQASCMSNYGSYYNTVSRESIVRRIKRYAGEEFSFEDFVAKDLEGMSSAKARTNRSSAKAFMARPSGVKGSFVRRTPVVHKGSPLVNGKVRKHK